jgi:hypothetical protein
MPSSTSASNTFVRGAVVAFVVTLLLVLVPYEALVRAAERKWGVEPARIAPRQTGVPHIDMFLEDVAGGVRYRNIAVGTSRVENGIAPEAIDPIAGRTYNLGLGLGSSLAAMELLESMHIQPERLIVGVSPMDFTQRALDHGRREIAQRHVAAVAVKEPMLDRSTREATYAVLHSATPERRRNLGQWLQLRREGGETLAFLNNEDATAKPDARQTHGFYPMAKVIAEEGFLHGGQRESVLADYANQRAGVAPLFIAAVRRFRARGVDVVLLHMPTTPAMRAAEASGTTFDRDIVAIAEVCGVPYVEGNALVGETFTNDRFNFADNEHMNETGALKFSRVLAQWLSERPRPAP